MSTLKVGVIGVGGIARMHMPGWAASPNAEVVAGADLVPVALEGWGADWDITRLETDSAAVINDPDIDIIDVCTPNMYHADLSIAALEAGKHVICEKPLAPTPADVQRMIEARDKSGKMLMTAQHFRFSGRSKALKAEIDTGALGDIYHGRSWMLRRTGIPTRLAFLSSQHSGGGACIDIGVHILDLTLWMMGNPEPVSVTGVARNVLAKNPKTFGLWPMHGPIPEGMDVEEMAMAFVRFETGATLMLEIAWLLHHDTMGEDMQMWLYGTDGGSHWPKCEIYQTNLDTVQTYNRSLQLTRDKAEPHAQECIEFAQAIVDGAPSPVPAEQSLQVMKILNAIYESEKTGREVLL
jgi:predicted dehydrogenase